MGTRKTDRQENTWMKEVENESRLYGLGKKCGMELKITGEINNTNLYY